MIESQRVVRSTDREAWLAARRDGVTATQVARAAVPSLFPEVYESRRDPQPVEVNDLMRFGTEQEPLIAEWVHRKFGIEHNDWLYCHHAYGEFLATPDGLGEFDGELVVAEIKTTGKDYDGGHIPIAHRRQMQWQMFVTGAVRCLYVWQLRVPDDRGWFFPGWLEPRTVWVERDEKMISDLVQVANALLLDEDFGADPINEGGKHG